MLRIDPAHPPLWRTPTTLQFGHAPLLVLDDPAPWQQRLVREFERGIPDQAAVPFAVALGADPRAAAEFVTRLGDVFASAAPPAPRVIVQAAGDLPREHVDAIAAALGLTGCEVTTADRFDPPGAPTTGAAPVVVVAHHLVAPSFAAALMADDRPHLPVVLTATGAEVGPYVRPGSTACLACVAARRRDDDPAWPVIAAQLLGRPLPAVDGSILWEAGIVAARLITGAASRPPRPRTRSLTLHAGSLRRGVRKHRPHEECRCRSLAGTATVAVPARLEPTTPRAYARPA
jgi:hypothetical protein